MSLTSALLIVGIFLVLVDILIGRGGRTRINIRRGEVNTFSIGLAVIALSIITAMAGL
jgi:hypothetical protein